MFLIVNASGITNTLPFPQAPVFRHCLSWVRLCQASAKRSFPRRLIQSGASIEDIKEYCRLCLSEESGENLRARYQIILKQRKEAYKRVEKANAVARYMDEKVAHYEGILAGLAPDDTNPKNWTAENRPKHEKETVSGT